MPLLPDDTRWRRLLLAILIGGLMLRLISACGLQYALDHRWHREFLIEGDAAGYWELAKQLARWETYSIYDPPRYALRMPGFPALLSLSISLFGENLFAARLMLATLGALSPWLVFLLGRRMFNEQIGTIAAALTALSPAHVVFSSVVLVEICFGLTIVLSLLSATALRIALQPLQRSTDQSLDRESGEPPSDTHKMRGSAGSTKNALWHACWTGVWIAAGVYLKPSWLLATFCFAGALVFCAPTGTRRKATIAGVFSILVTFLMLLPWGIRNQSVTGHFKFTTFWAGPSLYDGINPQATGDSDMRFFDNDNLTKTLTEFEVDEHYKTAAIDYAKQHPAHVVDLALKKSWRYWKPWPNADQFSHPVVMLAISSIYIPTLFFSLIGLRQLRGFQQQAITPFPETTYNTPKDKIWAVVILLGPVFYFAGIHAVFVSSLRYRLPAECPLYILAALGIWSCLRPTLSQQESD